MQSSLTQNTNKGLQEDIDFGESDKLRTKTICLSHVTDVDGLASAALVKMATDAEVVLVDYGDFLERLRAVEDVDRLFICDLGLSSETQSEFLKQLARILRFASITYLDHHPLKVSAKKEMLAAGIDLHHNAQECSSVLSYLEFKEFLPRTAGLLAAYGAVTDYRDNSAHAKEIMDRFDRQFILLESTILSYAITRKGKDQGFMMDVVEALSNLHYPHQIDHVLKYAGEQAESMAILLSKVQEKGIKMRNFAYIRKDKLATGNVANILIGAFNVPVGAAYKLHSGKGVFEVSLRGSRRCNKHLGSLVGSLASKLGGFGGGHSRASGARIPESKFEEFIELLDDMLER